MGLLYPDVNSTPGPNWATLLNNAGLLIDGHDHTNGKGKKIPLSTGININSDLDLTSTWNMINVRSLRLLNNVAVLTLPTDVGCVYEVAGDLWYNNGAGVPVHITSGSGLAFASLGTIGGDYGPGDPAEVSYSATLSLYTFTQDPGIAGAIASGDIYIYDMIVGGKYVHLKVKSGLIANYDLEFPDTLPATDSFLQVSATGKITNAIPTTFISPTGAVIDFAGSTAPAGWLLCYGQSVLVATYPDLFAVIGYTYGGAGVNFSLPDCRGRVTAGKDNMGGAAAGRITNGGCGIVGTTLGASGGDQRTATHGHALSGGVTALGSTSVQSDTESQGHQHQEAVADGSGPYSGPQDSGGGYGRKTALDQLLSWDENQTHHHHTNIAHGHNDNFAITNFSGGSSANVSPAIILNKIIKY